MSHVWSVFSTVLILLIFLALVAAMYRRTLPALIALPLMAIGMAAAAGVKWQDIATGVVEEGAFRLHKAYVTVLFGAMLAQVIQRGGIARALVRRAAELSGDKPIPVALVMAAVTVLLFTTLGGLGSVIMVATIVFPVLLAIGVPPLTAGALFLFALSTGGLLNLANWQFYMDTFGLTQSNMIAFAVVLFGLSLAALVVFVLVELGRRRAAVAAAGFSILSIGLVAVVFSHVGPLAVAAPVALGLAALGKKALPAALLLGTLREKAEPAVSEEVPWYAYLAPTLPVMIVAGFGVRNYFVPKEVRYDFPLVTAMLVGVLYGALTVRRPVQGRIQLIAASLIEGIKDVAPAVAIMLGIGMVVSSATLDPVKQRLTPLLSALPVGSPLGYIVLFILFAPLALYRGPLNTWGLGSGVAVALKEAGALTGAGCMGALMSVGIIQGICDPTNTHNVWIASNLQVDTNDLLRKTLPYAWAVTAVGVLVAAARFV